SMDIDLESNDTAQETIEEEVKAVEEAIVEEPAELSLDLDLDFDLDMDAEKNITLDETPEDIDLEIDMDIENPLQDEPEELLMEIDLDSSDITGDKTDENSEEIELELELETDEQLDAKDTTEKAIETPDEIDLSAIENMLDLDDGVELDEGKDNKIEEITLELDTEVEETTSPDASENELELEEVDLADLENMLVVKEETDDVIDLLDSTEKDLKEDDEQHIDATQTLDLTEIETMLDLDDSQNQNMESENITEEIELELDNDIEEEQDKDQKTDESFEKTGEFDISELESMLEITESDIEENIEEEQESDYHKKSDTIELEFDLDESDKADLYKNYTPDLEAAANKDKTDAAEAIKEDAEVTSDQNVEIETNTDITNTKKSIKKSGKKKINKLVAGLLILALMGGGGYGAYTLIKNKSIEIPAIITKAAELPYINNFFKDKKEDITGAIKITPLENSITGKSFTNAKAGDLFVIKGKIKNDYNHPRSFIRVKANIFLKGGVRSKTSIVYCGNILSNMDIENLEFDLIKKRLLNRNGDRKSNVNLKPGATLPFMVIFSNLPENMNMFNVEVESSTP
ncbi:MAG: DUF3426 domain-containing protein, partial [Desulfosarcina sp.]|nr:DUF3426 domain-containing protein [Desulfobacterales bacterium]